MAISAAMGAENKEKKARVRYRLLKPKLASAGMSATGVSGFDLYARDPTGRWRWVSATKPTAHEDDELLIRRLLAGEREYALYFPLFNGAEALMIGVPGGAKFTGLAPREKPIVFYYVPGDHLFGEDGDGGWDASHPNDLGFTRQATVMEPVLREALRGR